MKNILGRLMTMILTAVTLVSGCQCNGVEPDDIKYDKVMVMWSNGYNSLSNYLSSDIEDLQKGYLPRKNDNQALIIVSHLTSSMGDYNTPTSPQLIRLYRDKKSSTAVMDTLKSYSTDTKLGEASVMKSIMSEIYKQFPSDHYGLIFSSHATGWLPAGYYSDPENYDSKSGAAKTMSIPAPSGMVKYHDQEEEFPDGPAVKSFGATAMKVGTRTYSIETELPDFVDALPCHFDYVILDACLGGGIEVAYEFKDATDIICFSQAEVLAEGLNYKEVAHHLLEQEVPDVNAVAKDYFDQYATASTEMGRSATISVVDCRRLSQLAAVCKSLYSSYRTQIANLNPKSVQPFFRSYHHWFYDFEDILIKAGISASERKELENALNQCIPYKAATESFLKLSGGFKINIHSGFTMYLPCDGSPYLDNYYKTLSWNKATELVD